MEMALRGIPLKQIYAIKNRAKKQTTTAEAVFELQEIDKELQYLNISQSISDPARQLETFTGLNTR